MDISEEDFEPPPPEVVDNVRNNAISVLPEPNERPESFRRQKEFMDHEYPEWVDDVPPWRNPDANGETYLYVWQQHQARIRGHH